MENMVAFEEFLLIELVLLMRLTVFHSDVCAT